MQTRTLYVLLATAAMLAPASVLGIAASQSTTTGPDLDVGPMSTGRLVYPPTRWTITATICNTGDEASPVGTLTWTATPVPGYLTLGPGDTRVIGTVPFGALAAGACTTLTTFWGAGPEDAYGALNFGEFEFAAGVTISNDVDTSDNVGTVTAAFPAALAGTGVGGFDPPAI